MVFQLPSVKVLMVSHSDSESLIYKLKNSEILSRVETLIRRCKCSSVVKKIILTPHMGSEYVSREKKLTTVNFLIFGQKNVSTIRFQEIKIRPFQDFEKMRFLCFYIIQV